MQHDDDGDTNDSDNTERNEDNETLSADTAATPVKIKTL